MTPNLRFKAPALQYIVAAVLFLAGAGAAAYGLTAAPERTWLNLLLDGFYITSLAVSAMFFIASQRLTGARWSAGLRRIPEAFMAALPAAAVLMMALYFGRQWIYPWSRPGAFAHAPAIAGKVQYLAEPWVFVRSAVALLLWMLFAWLFRRTSLAQDRNPGSSLAYHYRLNRYAAAFVVVFALSFTLGSYDWIISLDPSWFSTMFGIYVFAGTLVQGLASDPRFDRRHGRCGHGARTAAGRPLRLRPCAVDEAPSASHRRARIAGNAGALGALLGGG